MIIWHSFLYDTRIILDIYSYKQANKTEQGRTSQWIEERNGTNAAKQSMKSPTISNILEGETSSSRQKRGDESRKQSRKYPRFTLTEIKFLMAQ